MLELSGGIFYATERISLMRNITLITAPIGLLLSIYFIYILEFGALGLAISMVLTQIIDVNIQLIYNCKFLDASPFKFIWHQIYASLCFLLLAFVSSGILENGSLILTLLFSGFIYTLLTVIVIFLMPGILSTNKKQIKDLFNLYILKKEGLVKH